MPQRVRCARSVEGTTDVGGKSGSGDVERPAEVWKKLRQPQDKMLHCREALLTQHRSRGS